MKGRMAKVSFLMGVVLTMITFSLYGALDAVAQDQFFEDSNLESEAEGVLEYQVVILKPSRSEESEIGLTFRGDLNAALDEERQIKLFVGKFPADTPEAASQKVAATVSVINDQMTIIPEESLFAGMNYIIGVNTQIPIRVVAVDGCIGSSCSVTATYNTYISDTDNLFLMPPESSPIFPTVEMPSTLNGCLRLEYAVAVGDPEDKEGEPEEELSEMEEEVASEEPDDKIESVEISKAVITMSKTTVMKYLPESRIQIEFPDPLSTGAMDFASGDQAASSEDGLVPASSGSDSTSPSVTQDEEGQSWCPVGSAGGCPGTCMFDQVCMSSETPCHICIDTEGVDITYYVMAKESPFEIVTWDEAENSQGDTETSFNTSSVMGLVWANPDSTIPGAINLESLAAGLARGVTDETNAYGERCFDDFKMPSLAVKQPAASVKKKDKKGKKQQPKEKQEYGFDPWQNIIIDGPVIACGWSGGEKALMVMDRNGNPTAKVLRSDLEKNPKAVVEALQRARAFNLKAQWFDRDGPLGQVSDYREKAISTVGGKDDNVIVAVIDSGIDLSHPNCPQYIWTNPDEIANNGIDDDFNGLVDDIHGWNFAGYNNDLTDKNGHGTHVAGIIAAKRNDAVNMAGVNPGAIIMPVKVTDEEGKSNSLRLYQGIQYAVNQGAQVIVVSLGGVGNSPLIRSAINYAHDMGVFVATASGKNGEKIGDVCPASANHAFTVGAIGLDGRRSPLSGFGPNNALLAPGEGILSLRSKDSLGEGEIEDSIQRLYVRRSGTSASASKAAGVVSLLLAEKSDLTPKGIEDILLGTADDMGVKGWDGQYGAGALNAAKALGAVRNTNFLTVKVDRFQINRDEDGIFESVDVYVTVRGDFRHFTVEIGEGENPRKFKPIARPFKGGADHAWVARIGKDNLADSKEWVVYIKVKENSGRVKSAQALLDLK